MRVGGMWMVISNHGEHGTAITQGSIPMTPRSSPLPTHPRSRVRLDAQGGRHAQRSEETYDEGGRHVYGHQ